MLRGLSGDRWKLVSIALISSMTVLSVIGIVGQYSISQAVALQAYSVFVTNGAKHPIPIVEEAQTKLYNFTDRPYNVTFNSVGWALVNLEPQSSTPSIAKTSGYREVCLDISRGSNSNVNGFLLFMGIIGHQLTPESSQTTLAEYGLSGTFGLPYSSQVMCHDVDGPEMSLLLSGHANTTDSLRFWVQLRS